MITIEIQASCFALTEGLRQHVIRRIEYALRSYRIWVDRVEVQLGDINGPRGGADKFCRVLVRLPNLPALVIRDLGGDLYAVIQIEVPAQVSEKERRLWEQLARESGFRPREG